jgi:eukaryotic-like serine/threonine-protein kinase
VTDPDAELRAWAPRPDERTAAYPDSMSLPGYSGFQQIAEGGEGVVYRARQDGLDRFVAIKVINVDDPARLARFRRELEITVRLGRQHPHIVTVIDTGTAPGGRPCIVMEYYDLGSLHDRLRERGPLPVEEVVAAGTAVADALAFAHAQGFLHRDVKPQNILVLPTSYVLADFGIARMADAARTTSLQMVSYRHAAPQMLEGGEPSAADDLWSLGSTLFTLLDGAPPFSSANPDEDTMLSYLERVRSAEPRPVRRADVPPALTAILDRCLSKRREDRFPDASALRAALTSVTTETVGWTPSMPIGDFGPRPEPPAPEPTPQPPPRQVEEDHDRTTLGPGSALAGLTVRLPDDRNAHQDFGPTPENYYPPPPVAVLPESPPWRPEPPAPDVTEERKHRRRTGRRLLLALVAVLVGGGIGVAATLLNGTDQPTGQRPPPSSTPAPSPSDPTVTGGDPAFAPTLDAVVDDGESITLTWTDPTGGRAQFVVLDVTGSRPNPLVTVSAGNTSHTVDGLDPAAEKYCYQIVAISLADTEQRGASARACTNR